VVVGVVSALPGVARGARNAAYDVDHGGACGLHYRSLFLGRSFALVSHKAESSCDWGKSLTARDFVAQVPHWRAVEFN